MKWIFGNDTRMLRYENQRKIDTAVHRLYALRVYHDAKIHKRDIPLDQGYRSPSALSRRIGILMPCVAKHLLRGVLSMTPGNFFAL